MIRRSLLLIGMLAVAAPSAAADPPGLLALPRSIDESTAPVPSPPSPASTRPPAADPTAEHGPDYRERMREIVSTLASYAHQRDPNFIILLHGGAGLVTSMEPRPQSTGAQDGGLPEASPVKPVLDRTFLKGINGLVLEGWSCGRPRSSAEGALARTLAAEGLRVLATDRCADAVGRAKATEVAEKMGAIVSFQDRAPYLGETTRPPHENPAHVTTLAAVHNFMMRMPPAGSGSVGEWLAALRETNHDMVIVDPYFGATPLSAKEVAGLKFKRLGSRRLAMAALSLANATIGRHYWKAEWKPGAPTWLHEASLGGNGFPVDYWNPEWKEILGNFFKGLMDLGYDGVMLDDVDTYANFDKKDPHAHE